MRLGTLGTAFLCVTLLAGAFAGGLAFLAPSAGPAREEASTAPSPPRDNHEPKPADETKAPQQAADEAPKPAPALATPAPRPEPKKSPLAFGVMAQADKVVGQRVTWIAQPISSSSAGHVFFAKGPKGEFSFGQVFLVKESVGRIIDDLEARYHERHRQASREKRRLREEERNRQIEQTRKATEQLRGGNAAGVRKSIEDSRKRTAEFVKERAERKARGKVPQAPPILVTVTGTVARMDTLLLIGYGQSNSVPVLRDVTVVPYAQATEKR